MEKQENVDEDLPIYAVFVSSNHAPVKLTPFKDLCGFDLVTPKTRTRHQIVRCPEVGNASRFELPDDPQERLLVEKVLNCASSQEFTPAQAGIGGDAADRLWSSAASATAFNNCWQNLRRPDEMYTAVVDSVKSTRENMARKRAGSRVARPQGQEEFQNSPKHSRSGSISPYREPDKGAHGTSGSGYAGYRGFHSGKTSHDSRAPPRVKPQSSGKPRSSSASSGDSPKMKAHRSDSSDRVAAKAKKDSKTGSKKGGSVSASVSSKASGKQKAPSGELIKKWEITPPAPDDPRRGDFLEYMFNRQLMKGILPDYFEGEYTDAVDERDVLNVRRVVKAAVKSEALYNRHAFAYMIDDPNERQDYCWRLAHAVTRAPAIQKILTMPKRNRPVPKLLALRAKLKLLDGINNRTFVTPEGVSLDEIESDEDGKNATSDDQSE